jgi:hypothetical protein
VEKPLTSERFTPPKEILFELSSVIFLVRLRRKVEKPLSSVIFYRASEGSIPLYFFLINPFLLYFMKEE